MKNTCITNVYKNRQSTFKKIRRPVDISLKSNFVRTETINFSNNIMRVTFLIIVLINLTFFKVSAARQEFYQIKIYVFNNKTQENRIDKYLKEAFLPALNRAGITKTGVFKPVESDTAYGKRIYVLIPFKSMTQFLKLSDILEKDVQYKETGKDYLDALHNDPPYDHIESILLKAFIDMPRLQIPQHATSPSERIYELRSYKSATEKLYNKKVHMFNQGGEIKIFEKLKFNAVFYGEVLSGNSMPNLMYMTTFANKAARDEHWDTFRADPDWKTLSGLKEYENTVSRSQIFFLFPTDYSEI